MRKIIISLFALVFIYFCTPTPQEAPNTFPDIRDGKVYKTVTIGEQVWMAENLAYLPSVVGPATGSYTDPCYYVYDYDGTDVDEAKATTNYQTYGVLYNWPAALTACPEGWYLPCDEEWTLLEIYLANNGHNFDGTIGGDYFRSKIAKSLASDTGWNYWDIEGAPGNTDYPEYINKSGFSALPGGYRSPSGAFFGIGVFSFWWSSTEIFTRNCVWRRAMSAGDSTIYKVCSNYSRGYSVRCLRENNLPSVTTGLVTNVTKTTASFSVTVTGVSSVTARGVCWSTSENPTTSDSKTTDGMGLGTYTSNITGLSPNTTYYVRAYATNTNGIAYGQQRSFITQNEQGPVFGNFTDFRDGNQYETVTIGSQVWMAENLAYLPNVVGPATESDTDPYYYVYGYDGTDVEKAKANEYTPSGAREYTRGGAPIKVYETYGVLYNWPAALTACPEGWHLPSDAEWKQLEMYLGMSQEEADDTSARSTYVGVKLKEAGINHWYGASYNTEANSSGFTALPGGYRVSGGPFDDIGLYGYWWSSTQRSEGNAWNRSLSYSIGYVFRYYYFKAYGYSVRCLRD
ncbi:MAG: FISUMP domain-containing protein [Bacteroidales bacterium]|nr:FISUMP domain-containing protein [Bacteroidales bacterium]